MYGTVCVIGICANKSPKINFCIKYDASDLIKKINTHNQRPMLNVLFRGVINTLLLLVALLMPCVYHT